jgi:hypothetical protein
MRQTISICRSRIRTKTNSMIYNKEFNPRNYDGYFDMIGHLREDCIRKCGAPFNVTKIAMGQVSHNSEICWFEGYVDDEAAAKGKKQAECDRQAEEAIKFLEVNGYVVTKATDKKIGVVNVHVDSLGNFHIHCDGPDTYGKISSVRDQIIESLTNAIKAFK